jgi:hypothetical protein
MGISAPLGMRQSVLLLPWMLLMNSLHPKTVFTSKSSEKKFAVH